ncbi:MULTISPECIES: hypothetical protein [Rhizobium]|uniref:Uncharacterized protein n=2 Tax=Rhizobium TaxID=379 RepID=A0A387G3P4_9HYPH|nr:MULTISPECIES: hypothetical protein [Rhizobium]AYG63975.1 hypothetical protein CCGE525_34670 [Rhizobium jaguaris]MDL2402915.1 hypothetical protein [Rhizobium mayense]
MKTQQRKFVVELKSARRRTAMRPASIWGDTDLKALALEAEVDAPHLFEPNVVSNGPKREGEPWADPKPKTRLNNNFETGDDKQISAPSLDAGQICPPQQDNGLTFTSVSPLKEGSSRRPRKDAKHRRDANVNYHANDTASLPSAQSNDSHGDISVDELIALDEENRRLKALLVKHLLQQNMQIRKMLARFGVN